MKNEATFEKIEAWLSDELPEAEARAFAAEIAADTALAAMVERHRRGREALDRLAEQTLQADLARWRESLDELPEPPADVLRTVETTTWLRWIFGGLLLIFLGVAAYWFWPSKNIQPGNIPVPENISPQTSPEVPIVVTPPNKPVNGIKNPTSREENNSPRLVAMAETNLGDLHAAILQQYGQTMGDEEEESLSFTAGIKAFKQNNFQAAKKNLLLILKSDSYFPSAQEMLAVIYLLEKNYPKALQSYESFASQSDDPATDWRLLQFYLIDYQNHKANFSKKLAEISNSANHHRFQKEAENLKRELAKIGVD